VGRIGMNVKDFDGCTPREFNAIVEAWNTDMQNGYRETWERVRTQCFFIARSHSTDNFGPKDIMHFDWDKESGRSKTTDPIADKKHYEEIKKQRGLV